AEGADGAEGACAFGCACRAEGAGSANGAAGNGANSADGATAVSAKKPDKATATAMNRTRACGHIVSTFSTPAPAPSAPLSPLAPLALPFTLPICTREREIHPSGNAESDKPGVVIDGPQRRNHQTGPRGCAADERRGDAGRVPAAGIA